MSYYFMANIRIKDDFEAWYKSDEYQEILKYRLSAYECDTILIRGKS